MRPVAYNPLHGNGFPSVVMRWQVICPFCEAVGFESEISRGWRRCPNEHMWLPPDGGPVKPEARTIWICELCSDFRGSYRELLHHLVDVHDHDWARRELQMLALLVEAVRELMAYDKEKARRQRRSDPITETEVAAFREFLHTTEHFDFHRPGWTAG